MIASSLPLNLIIILIILKILIVLHSDTTNGRCSLYFLYKTCITVVISKSNDHYLSLIECKCFGIQNQMFALLIIICFNLVMTLFGIILGDYVCFSKRTLYVEIMVIRIFKLEWNVLRGTQRFLLVSNSHPFTNTLFQTSQHNFP